MIRVLPFLLEMALLVFCLIDCIQTDSVLVRNLPKVGWILLIIILPLVGGIAWLVAGRPTREQQPRTPWPSTGSAGFPEHERPARRRSGPAAPDDDPEFLAGLKRADSEHEEVLERWEQDLKAREAHLRATEDGSPPAPPTS